MAASSLKARTFRWRPCEGVGLEHVEIKQEGSRIVAKSVVIGEHEGRAYGARYELVCDDAWRSRSLTIEASDGRTLRMESNGEGRWNDAAGKRLAKLDGCIDLDLSASPLTNTLPLRRCGVGASSGSMQFRMALVPFDTFEPFADEQIYTPLGNSGRFRFQAADGSFEAEIAMDEERFVLSYPPLYERV